MADKRRTDNLVEKKVCGKGADAGKMKLPEGAFNNLPWTIHLLARRMGIDSRRFRSLPGMAFSCQEVESIARISSEECEIRTNIGGLDGLSGPLPPWLNDILALEDAGNAPLGDFLNIFSHRFIESLYLSWTKYRPDISYQIDGRDPISKMLFSLLGARLMTEETVDMKGDFQANRILPYVGTAGHRPRSAAGLREMLSRFFSPVKIEVKEFMPRKVAVPREDRACMDGKSVQLGKNTVLGEQVKDVAGAFRIVVGPADLRVFMQFVPGEKQFRQLKYLTRMYISGLLVWDLAVRIKGSMIPALDLSTEEKKNQLRLGYNTWLVSGPGKDYEVVFQASRRQKGVRR